MYCQNELAELKIDIDTYIGATIAVKNKLDGTILLKCKGEEKSYGRPREY